MTITAGELADLMEDAEGFDAWRDDQGRDRWDWLKAQAWDHATASRIWDDACRLFDRRHATDADE